MLDNVQFGASNGYCFNADSSQGPSIAEIRNVEVQKDASTPPNPAAPKTPKSAHEEEESEEQKHRA